jgi:hypothetical protein
MPLRDLAGFEECLTLRRKMAEKEHTQIINVTWWFLFLFVDKGIDFFQFHPRPCGLVVRVVCLKRASFTVPFTTSRKGEVWFESTVRIKLLKLGP